MEGNAGLERLSTSDRVREILLERILDGTYEPGDRIIEMQVARELDTSQAPVREALRELQGLRLVTAEPYRGTRVREVTEREMREALEVRAVLEEFAARRGIEALGDRVDELRSVGAAMRTAAEERNIESFAHHDVMFHRMIVEAAENDCLLRTWQSLGVEIRIRLLLRRSGVDLGRVAAAHDPILDALARGDAEAAGVLLRAHPETIYRLAEEQEE